MQNNPADSGSNYGFLGAAAPYVALLFMLYSTNSGMKALFNALNILYDKEERRSFLRFNVITKLFTLATIVMIFVATALFVAEP